MWSHLVLYFQVLHSLVLHFQRPQQTLCRRLYLVLNVRRITHPQLFQCHSFFSFKFARRECREFDNDAISDNNGNFIRHDAQQALVLITSRCHNDTTQHQHQQPHRRHSNPLFHVTNPRHSTPTRIINSEIALSTIIYNYTTIGALGSCRKSLVGACTRMFDDYQARKKHHITTKRCTPNIALCGHVAYLLQPFHRACVANYRWHFVLLNTMYHVCMW